MTVPIPNAPCSNCQLFRVMSVIALTGVLAVTAFAPAAQARGPIAVGPSAIDLGVAVKYRLLAAAAITAPGSVIDGHIGAGAAITISGTTITYEEGGVTYPGLIEPGAALTGDAGHYSTISDDMRNGLADLDAAYTAGKECFSERLKEYPSPIPGCVDMDPVLITDNLAGMTLKAGMYHAGAGFALSASIHPLILDGDYNAAAVWLFQTDASMVVEAGRKMELINGASADRVFWIVDGAFTSGAGAAIVGNIISKAAITLGAGTQLNGRALSVDAAITAPGCTLE
ncbi:MAG: hypothetical protein ACI9W6_002356 [Motiliproteus sp.]|jgi:hypothetical protein